MLHKDDQDMTPPPLFLGFDLSTQQLKVIALCPIAIQDSHSTTLRTHSSFAVQFDRDLPHYGTHGGVSVRNDGVVTAPVLMWVEALGLVLDRMKESAFPFERVCAISGAAQQHGSVYWSCRAQEGFDVLRDDKGNQNASLTGIFKDAFVVYDSPIWQDTSTTAQCQEIEEFMGRLDRQQRQQDDTQSDRESIRLCGQQRLAELTGSRAYERYTASQILKIVQKNPDMYEKTERISLVSSFLASLLMAQFAKIDVADGSGMNLIDITTKTWDPRLTTFISQGGTNCQPGQGAGTSNTLAEKLGQVDSSGREIQGVVSKWFVERYGFRSDVSVVSFTGDNPATVLAMRAEQGDAIVSLGTSDTLLLYTNSHGSVGPQDGNGASQAGARLSIGYLCHPVDPNGYLMLYCAKNGSLARERIRDLYAEGQWNRFDQYLKDAIESEQGSASCIGFYFFDREIWPPVEGVHRFQDGRAVDEFGPCSPSTTTSDDGRQRANVLAICESQFMAMRIRSSQEESHSSSLSPAGISRILATGGASSNPAILQLLSNVFGVPVVSTSHNAQAGTGSAAWGAARKAFLYGRNETTSQSQDATLTSEERDASGEKQAENSIFLPDLKQTRKYVDLVPEFVRLEATLLQGV